MNKMKFDIRLLEYNLSQGTITKEDYNKFLEQLEDSSHLIDMDADDDLDSIEEESTSSEEEVPTESH